MFFNFARTPAQLAADLLDHAESQRQEAFESDLCFRSTEEQFRFAFSNQIILQIFLWFQSMSGPKGDMPKKVAQIQEILFRSAPNPEDTRLLGIFLIDPYEIDRLSTKFGISSSDVLRLRMSTVEIERTIFAVRLARIASQLSTDFDNDPSLMNDIQRKEMRLLAISSSHLITQVFDDSQLLSNPERFAAEIQKRMMTLQIWTLGYWGGIEQIMKRA